MCVLLWVDTPTREDDRAFALCALAAVYSGQRPRPTPRPPQCDAGAPVFTFIYSEPCLGTMSARAISSSLKYSFRKPCLHRLSLTL